jgi:tetratricopeptide (TPR) repeat protein
MPILLSLLPILVQISSGGIISGGSEIPIGKARMPARRGEASSPAPPPPLPPPIQPCQTLIDTDLDEAIERASDWVARAKDADFAEAQGCLGMAHARKADFDGAEKAFIAARDAAGADHAKRANWGAMAGNAAIAGGQPARALVALALAHDDALTVGDKAAQGEIAFDKARALVALGRAIEAKISLTEATTAIPENSDVWLLSATLYRRTAKLDIAQQHIEKAAALSPLDPAIGLEAGVIAELAGREEAARKSWKSVVAAAPQSAEAAQAKAYLEQIGESAAQPSPAPPAKPESR